MENNRNFLTVIGKLKLQFEGITTVFLFLTFDIFGLVLVIFLSYINTITGFTVRIDFNQQFVIFDADRAILDLKLFFFLFFILFDFFFSIFFIVFFFCILGFDRRLFRFFDSVTVSGLRCFDIFVFTVLCRSGNLFFHKIVFFCLCFFRSLSTVFGNCLLRLFFFGFFILDLILFCLFGCFLIFFLFLFFFIRLLMLRLFFLHGLFHSLFYLFFTSGYR